MKKRKRAQALSAADLFYDEIARRAQLAESRACTELRARLATVEKKLEKLAASLHEWAKHATHISNDVSVDCACCGEAHDASTMDFESGAYLDNSEARVEKYIQFIARVRQLCTPNSAAERAPPP